MTLTHRIDIPKLLFYAFTSLLLALIYWPISGLFTRVRELQATLCIFSVFNTVTLIPSIYKNIIIRQSRRRLQGFVQAVLSQLHSGHSLHCSISNVFTQSEWQRFSSHSRKNTQKIRNALSANTPLPAIIDLLKPLFACQESALFFTLIRDSSLLGNTLTDVFTQFSRDLRQTNREEERRLTQRTQIMTECLTLIVLPPLMLWGLRQMAMDYLLNAYNAVLGKQFLLGSYLLFQAAIFSLRFLSIGKGKPRKRTLKKLPRVLKQRYFLKPLTIHPLLEKKTCDALRLIHPNCNEDELYFYRRRHSMFRLIGLNAALCSAVICTFFKLPFIFAVLLCIICLIYSDYKLHTHALEYQQFLRFRLVPLFRSLQLILSAGFTLHNAFLLCETLYQKDTVLSEELGYICNCIRNHQALKPALHKLANKTSLIQAELFVDLLKLHLDSGCQEDLPLLTLQSQDFFQSMEQLEQKTHAIQANRSLLPMTLDLLSIILLSLAPVIDSLKI